MKKKLPVLALMISLSMVMTGCSFTRNKNAVNESETNEIDYVESMDELEENQYYVYHDGKFQKPYIHNASFNTKEDNSSSTSDDKVAWFNNDWTKIPTLYDGDYIVYYTSDTLDEKFNIERYEYLGYTVGICQMTRLSSGRYEVATGENDDTVNLASDAARILDEGSETAIIDNIGGAQLRSGNISRAGTIVGLKQNSSYSADVYFGTTLKTYVLKADSIALCSMETVTITDYTFLRSKVLRINLPDYINDGYYNINGSGIFRYVKGKSYTENTDFNVPNDIPEQTADTDKEQQQIGQEANAVVTEEFTVNKEGETTIVVTYGENFDVDYDIADPTGKIIGDSAIYTLTNKDDGTMEVTVNLKAGKYKLEISGLYGRTYKYEVTQKAE